MMRLLITVAKVARPMEIILAQESEKLWRVARDPSAESTVVASQSPTPIDSPEIRNALGKGARRTSARSMVVAQQGPRPIDREGNANRRLWS